MKHLQSVAKWVRDANALLGQLDQLLDAEFSALERRDSDRHVTISQEKARVVEALAASEGLLLSALGQTNEASLSALLKEHFAGEQTAQEEYRRFQELTRQCAEKNAMNGAIIEAKRANTSKLLHILHGATDASVYGRDARVSEANDRVRLASV